MSEHTLNDKQIRFCQEYIIDLNVMQAYIRAGYEEDSAQSNSYRLMENDGIKAYIEDLMSKRANRLRITADEVLMALWKNHTAADKISDSNKSLELLGRHLKLFTDKVELDGNLPPARLIVELTNTKAKNADSE